jgi:hypothetical protein
MARSTLPSKTRTASTRAALKSAGTASALPSADEVSRQLEGAMQVAERVARIGGGGPQRVAVSTNLTAELNNIDFAKMIGGPLQAAVDAQVASSLATVNFIKEVGFEPVTGSTSTPPEKKLVMVDFTHKRPSSDPTVPPVDVKITVPLLAMLPIPSLRIEHVIIDFNVKLNSVESSSVSTDLKVGANVGGRLGPVNFKVSASYQRKTATSVEVKKEYALNVNVKAVQDEIPAGLEKILNILAA